MHNEEHLHTLTAVNEYINNDERIPKIEILNIVDSSESEHTECPLHFPLKMNLNKMKVLCLMICVDFSLCCLLMYISSFSLEH